MEEIRRIEDKVFDFITQHHMLSPGDKVVAGVSGGADSVCLLFVLMEWARRSPVSLVVVHVNHGIREDAGRDASYVERLCAQHGIPFYLEKADVREKARKEKISEEEAGRLVRYDAFRRAAESFGADRIAVAHNANDQAETMLFHLFRGSGLSGLSGIRPVREQIIRPILCLERTEVEAYLDARQIPYCCDDTNEEDDYTRNRIRHHILPFAEENVARGCVSHMARTADLLMQTEDYLQEQTSAAGAVCVGREEKDGSIYVDVAAFLALHPVIRGRLLFQLLKSLSPEQKDISYIHVQDALGLFEKEGSRRICLPYGIRCRRQYGKVILEQNRTDRKSGGADANITIHTADIPPQGMRADLPGIGELELTVFSSEKRKDIPEKRYTKWFDYDKIKKSLIIRTRQTGDYLTIRGKEPSEIIHKQVKDYMVTEKIPREQRDSIPLLAEENHILWVAGYRISEYYKISENTKCILQVQLRRSRESGGMEETNGGTNQGAVK